MRDKSGKYLLTTRLGTGGMGQVWSAIKQGDDGLRMPCAIKVLHPALAMTSEDRERFFGEARIAAQLDHGRIVKVVDTSEVQGSPCLVMEWVDGVNLRELLERAAKAGTRRLGVDISLYIVGEILSALEYAHGRTVAGQHAGVVHYDVTPGNILVSSSGEVKLTDFGIARFAKLAEATMSRSVGTPRYMSPEQMTGRVRTQTDIYSLGVVLHELLEGERFLGDCSPQEFQARVLGGHIPALTQTDVPAWVDQLRRRMLQTTPEDRPPAGDAHWMIVENTTRYQVAARELKVLYARIIGKPRSGFTELIELRNNPQLQAALFDDGDSQPVAVAPDLRTRADGPVESDAPAAFRKPFVQVADGLVDHHTVERTNTGAAAPWAALDQGEVPIEPTVRLPAFEPPSAPAAASLPPTAPPLTESAVATERAIPIAIEPAPAMDESPPVVVEPTPVRAETRASGSKPLIIVSLMLALVCGVVFIGSVFVFLRDDAATEPTAEHAAVEPERQPATTPPPEAPTEVAEPPPRAEPAPAVTPEPEPAPEPTPAIEPELEPTPQPQPDPAPEPEPEPAAKPKPAPKPKPASKPSIEVTFVIANVSTAELEVGSRSLSYRSFAMTKLKPGKYPVRWRKGPSDPWQSPGTLKVEDGLPLGTFYDVKLTATTLVAKPNSKGSAK